MPSAGPCGDLRGSTRYPAVRALQPAVSLTEKNLAGARGSAASSRLDLRIEDLADDDEFNRILWVAIKGDTPYPGSSRLTASGTRAE